MTNADHDAPQKLSPMAEYVPWLLERAMMAQGQQLARQQSGQGAQWRNPYALAQPRAAATKAAVWFTAYPPAVITAEKSSVLATLGDERLWQAFAEIGIQGIHTGPMKMAGGLTGRTYTPTIDGYFDRIGLAIAPEFGTVGEFIALADTAQRHGATVIDDIVPGHTGKGADFRLAELGYGDYPGIYHMVAIAPEDWSLLPSVPTGADAANLSPATVDTLQAKGYIVGRLSRVIFYEPGVKETNWSVTPIIEGVDGIARRWVYLHYFKAGQPTLNWLDPTFAAPRLVLGDALHSLTVLGAGIVRLDANGFLGVEQRAGGPAWSEGHPLSITANQLIAGLVRKMGGFSFQELNLTVDDIAAMSQGGADLAYDFITRPAYHHALVTGNTAFLRLMLRTVHEFGIDPASLVHALQNHDELTLELVHFWTLHKDDHYILDGQTFRGSALREEIRQIMYDRLTGAHAPYNHKFVTNGVASTTASVIAAALGIRNLDALTTAQKAQIQQCHLLLAMYNALQPGIFALSGWDLVGALPLAMEEVAPLVADGDTRWIHRGAYDLFDGAPATTASRFGLPKAKALYGSLTAQLTEPASFANQLKAILDIRRRYRIYESHQLAIPDVATPALLIMVHRLPEAMGIQITALNFGEATLQEAVDLAEYVHEGQQVVNMIEKAKQLAFSKERALPITLTGYQGKSFLITD